MKLTRLRLVGFKSFVEPTDFLIEPGLTGVVGPNGCGKSNLVEALRWVMGESSHKTMRAAGMDDVIFAGSGDRPARNMAEVLAHHRQRDRTAPAAFNDADLLEVSRRIEREEGSTYRINGREVRARDVQLLFADASTGARSPALVRQGQISELIAAKPQTRRRILEEAAGIAGPALAPARGGAAPARRREQPRPARGRARRDRERRSTASSARRGRRRAIAVAVGEIRRAEAVLFHIAFEEAGRRWSRPSARSTAISARVAERTSAQAEAARPRPSRRTSCRRCATPRWRPRPPCSASAMPSDALDQ